MNSNLAQEIVRNTSSHIYDMGWEGEYLSLIQQDAIMNAVNKAMNGKTTVLQADLQGIYNALEYACSFIKAGHTKMDDTAHQQLLNAMSQIGRYTTGEPESAADLTAESNDPRSHVPITFKVDGVPIRVGQDMRIEYEDREAERTLIVVLSYEGIIMDVWDKGGSEPTVTSSITFDEQIDGMLDTM